MLARILRAISWRLTRLAEVVDRKDAAFHAGSVRFRDTMTANNEAAFEKMYADPQMLEHYLVAERLEFFGDVASRVDKLDGIDRSKAEVIDVGCGTGHLLLEMRKLGFAGRLVGMDSAHSAEGPVLAHNVGLEFLAGYTSDYAWVDEFDVTLCTEVLEHCEHPDEIVRDMLRAVRPGGWVVITVPDGRKDTWEGHVNFWSPESFKVFLDSFGYPVTYDYFENTNFGAIRRIKKVN